MSNNVKTPVPPPPPIISKNIVTNVRKSEPNTYPKIDDSYCVWAIHYPELRLACARFRLCIERPPFALTYKHISSILQEGPTCGLVVLSMLLDKAIQPSQLLAIAKSKNISKNGEVFDVRWLALLLDAVSSTTNNSLKYDVKNTRLFSKEVVEYLLAGCTLLVPYDCDKNHTPCLRKGHKAHWAIVTGVLITEQMEDLEVMSPEYVYVTAKHGKSIRVAVWSLYDLDKSNNNLEEFSPEREYDTLEYLLPEGGLVQGLKGKFILIHPF